MASQAQPDKRRAVGQWLGSLLGAKQRAGVDSLNRLCSQPVGYGKCLGSTHIVKGEVCAPTEPFFPCSQVPGGLTVADENNPGASADDVRKRSVEMANVIESRKGKGSGDRVIIKTTQIAEGLVDEPVGRSRQSHQATDQRLGDRLVADKHNGITFLVVGEDVVGGSDGSVAYVAQALTARDLDLERVAAPPVVEFRPAGGDGGVRLPGPATIVHASKARHGLHLQAMGLCNCLSCDYRSLERTGVNGCYRKAGQAAGGSAGLGLTVVGQG